MIVFGTKGVTKKTATGSFWCPNCNQDRKYTRYEVSKKGHVFFVPLVDRGVVASYVECRNCRTQFDPGVLRAPTKEALTTDLNMLIRASLAVMISADSDVDDREISLARRLNRELTDLEIDDEMQRRDVAKANIDELLPLQAHFADRLSEKGKVQILKACAELAAVDAPISSIEMHMLRRIAVPLGVPVEYLPGIIESATA